MSEKSEVVKPSTLWSIYSMLKTTLRVQENVDLGQFYKQVVFLKQQIGYKANKWKMLNNDAVRTFLIEATYVLHLMRKVTLIFGIYGACRCDELIKLTVNNVEDKESLVIVKIPDTKTYKPRMFTIVYDK